jgi:uncharacterized protein YjbJ (UPF0337 family)
LTALNLYEEGEWMNSDILKGKWLQLRGDLKQAWGNLTDDELTQIEGSSEKLVGKLQEKYGYSQERAEMEVDQFRSHMERKYRKDSH